MTICVTNCLHWIGFHVVNRLLEDGYPVDGIANMESEREEDLFLLLGRNSLFSLYSNEDQIKEKKYTDVILADGSKQRSIQLKKTFNLGTNRTEPPIINVELPLLFGEWMPMDENGVYVSDQYIQFDSDQFQDNAIYIDDFVDCLMQWMKAPDLPQVISLTKDKTLQVEENQFEKQMYMRENRLIDDQITNLKKHYERIKILKM